MMVMNQLEDGIGMIRLLRSVIDEDLANLELNNSGSFTFITGHSAYEEILKVAQKITATNNKINIKCKKNSKYIFWRNNYSSRAFNRKRYN